MMRILLEFQLILLGRNGVLDAKLPEDIQIKSVNGKGIQSGPKHLSHGLNSIEPGRGRVGKV